MPDGSGWRKSNKKGWQQGAEPSAEGLGTNPLP